MKNIFRILMPFFFLLIFSCKEDVYVNPDSECTEALTMSISMPSNISTYAISDIENYIDNLRVFITDNSDNDLCSAINITDVPLSNDSIFNISFKVSPYVKANGKHIYVIANGSSKLNRSDIYGLVYTKTSDSFSGDRFGNSSHKLPMSGVLDCDLSSVTNIGTVHLVRMVAKIVFSVKLHDSFISNIPNNRQDGFILSIDTIEFINYPSGTAIFGPEPTDNTSLDVNYNSFKTTSSNSLWLYPLQRDNHNRRFVLDSAIYINENFKLNESDYNDGNIFKLDLKYHIRYYDVDSVDYKYTYLYRNDIIPIKIDNSYKIRRNCVYYVDLILNENFDYSYIYVTMQDWDEETIDVENRPNHTLSLSASELMFKIDPTKDPVEYDRDTKYIYFSSDTIVDVTWETGGNNGWFTVTSPTNVKNGVITVTPKAGTAGYQDVSLGTPTKPYNPGIICVKMGNVTDTIYVRQLNRVALYDAYSNGNSETVGTLLMNWGTASGWNDNNTLKGNTIPALRPSSYGCSAYWIYAQASVWVYEYAFAKFKWRLPTVSEMQNVFTNKSVLEWNGHAGMLDGTYWTMDEVDKDNAYVVSNAVDPATSAAKTNTTLYKARCIIRDDAWNGIVTYSE